MRASLVAQMVKNPLAMWETQVQSLGWEDLLEEEVATPPVFLSGEARGQRSLAMESQRLGHHWATKHSTMRQTNAA